MSKDKGGRETKKPKQDKKVKGQTPAPRAAALDAISGSKGAAPKS